MGRYPLKVREPGCYSARRQEVTNNSDHEMVGGGSYSPSQLFLALCVATGLAAGCVLLATAEPLLASTPAELRGGSPASRRLSRGANRDSSGRSPTLRRLSGAAKGRRKADGPPPAGITVSYTPEEGYRSQEGQDKWVDQQIFGGKRCLSMVTVARAATRCPRSPPAGSGLLPGPERRAPAAWMPKRGCRRRSPPLRASRHGTFVDLGCYDGVTYSNTWYFETKLGWSGVCVEPNPAVFPRIASQAGRASGVLAAVSRLV